MGKVLKIVGTIVAVAAATIITAGAINPALLPALGATAGAAGAGAASATILGVKLGTFLAAGLVTSAIGSALSQSKLSSIEETGAADRGRAFADPNALGIFSFGTTVFPSALVYEEAFGTNNEQITGVYAHCFHKINSYQTLYVDGEQVSFSGDDATGDYNGILKWRRATGVDPQSNLTLDAPGWPGTADGDRVAHSALEWNLGNNQTKVTGGVPQRIVVKGEGALLYDPRNGTHDWTDPSTWSFNNGNAALVALRYIIGEYSAAGDLIWGMGLDEADVDTASFQTAANVADVTVDGVPRYRLGGVYPTNGDHEGFFRLWEQNTGGKITRVAGKIYCWLPNNDLTSIYTITDDDILADVGVTMQVANDPRNLINTVRGRYISASQLYQAVPYPEVRESSYVTQDNNKLRILELDFSWVQDIETAERVARISLRRTRYGRVFTFGMDWRGTTLDLFDVVTINLPETDNTNVLARLVDKQVSVTGLHIMTFQEENANIYSEPGASTAPSVGTAPGSVDPADTLLFEPNSTAGAVGNIPPGVRKGNGVTNIIFTPNENAGGFSGPAQDGKIRVVNGFYRNHNGGIRQVKNDASGGEVVLTGYNTATAGDTPRDETFYLLVSMGSPTDQSARFTTITGTWGSASVTSGFFVAEYDRSNNQWYCRGDDGSEEAFTPGSADICVAIGQKALASTAIDNLQEIVAPPHGFNDIDSKVWHVGNRQEQGDANATPRNIPLGVQDFFMEDGQQIAFSEPYQNVPTAQFGGGGKMVAGDQQVYRAILSSTHITATLKTQGIGTPTSHSETTSSAGTGADPDLIITKDATATEANDDAYEYVVTVDADDGGTPEFFNGWVDVGFYSDPLGDDTWTKRGEARYTTTGQKTKLVIADGMGIDAEFGVNEEDVSQAPGNGITAFNRVDYETGGIGTPASATPSGASPVIVRVTTKQEN